MTSNQVVPDGHADVTYHDHYHHRKIRHSDGHSFNSKYNSKSKRRRQYKHSTKPNLLKTVDVESLFANSSNENITTNMAVGLDKENKLVTHAAVNDDASSSYLDRLSDPLNALSNSKREFVSHQHSENTKAINACSLSSVTLGKDTREDPARKCLHELAQNTNVKQHDTSRSPTIKRAPVHTGKAGDQETIAMLDKYIKSCQANYVEIESQIDLMFRTLLASLNHRREVLIEEAKLIRDRKIKSLKELKEKCLGSQNVSPAERDPVNVVEHKTITSGRSETSGNQVKSEETLFCINAVTAEDGTEGDTICLGKLEEGNMTFNYNEEEIHFINKFGNIREDLSSSQFSSTKGLYDSGGIIGEEVHFEVHTRNICGEMNWNTMDKIEIRICDSSNNSVNVDQTSSPEDDKSFPFKKDTASSNENSNNGVYCYSFVPLRPGAHEILVTLNDIEISTSPFIFIAYPKLDLTFTAENKSHENSEASNDSCSEDDDWYPNTLDMTGRDWSIQKDGKSILLRSLRNRPSHIYASEEVDEMCAWQIRVTTACMNIVLSIGVKTRSGIPDLDEQFTCDFHLKTFVGTSSALDKANHAKCSFGRQVSTFTRMSWTFTVLINNGILRVTCDELNEDRRMEIRLAGTFTLHPFCSMTHHHDGAEYMSCVCPSPQLTLL